MFFKILLPSGVEKRALVSSNLVVVFSGFGGILLPELDNGDAAECSLSWQAGCGKMHCVISSCPSFSMSPFSHTLCIGVDICKELCPLWKCATLRFGTNGKTDLRSISVFSMLLNLDSVDFWASEEGLRFIIVLLNLATIRHTVGLPPLLSAARIVVSRWYFEVRRKAQLSTFTKVNQARTIMSTEGNIINFSLRSPT